MTFIDVQRDVMTDFRLSSDWFGQSVKYRTGDGDEYTLDVHTRHTIRRDHDDQGNEVVIEQVHCEIDRQAIPAAPTHGSRMILEEDDQAYLYGYQGKHRPTSYRATFERRRVMSQGR